MRQGWEKLRFDEVAILQRGHDLPAHMQISGEHPVVTSSGITGTHNEFIARGPGVLTGRSGSVGRVHYIEQDYWPHNTTLYVIDFKGNLPRYIYYLLQFIDPAKVANSTGVPTLDRNNVHKLVVDHPPLAEQKRIVAILDEKLAAVEQARAAAQAQLQAAQALPAAYLRAVFESEEAQEWPAKRIEEIAQTTSGTTPSRGRSDYYSSGAIPWIKTGELKDGIIESSEEYVTDLALQETSLKLLPIDTLLMAMYGQGQTRGRTGILKVPATINQACFAILPNPEIFTTGFLQLWFRHNYVRLREESENRGGNQPNLNGNIIRDLEVPLPPPSNQKQILSEINEKLEGIKNLEQALLDQLSQIEQLPAALLRQAFTGEL